MNEILANLFALGYVALVILACTLVFSVQAHGALWFVTWYRRFSAKLRRD